jgi:glycosyltransferase involved in cell wall biosynthesis
MDTGYLVEFGNMKQLRDMLQYVLNNPAEVATKTQKAKAFIIANLSLGNGITKYENLYEDCIRQNVKTKEMAL